MIRLPKDIFHIRQGTGIPVANIAIKFLGERKGAIHCLDFTHIYQSEMCESNKRQGAKERFVRKKNGKEEKVECGTAQLTPIRETLVENGAKLKNTIHINHIGCIPGIEWLIEGCASKKESTHVNGIGNGSLGGLYNGSISVAAVPEPETYAMLLAGMGVMGFIARRRNKAQ